MAILFPSNSTLAAVSAVSMGFQRTSKSITTETRALQKQYLNTKFVSYVYLAPYCLVLHLKLPLHMFMFKCSRTTLVSHSALGALNIFLQPLSQLLTEFIKPGLVKQ